jgi:hypothetical protein
MSGPLSLVPFGIGKWPRSRILNYVGSLALLLGAGLVLGAKPIGEDRIGPDTPLHYAPNGNFGPDTAFLPGVAHYNLADVDSLSRLEALPDGVRGLVWVGQCKGVDAAFIDAVSPYLGHSRVFGFYLMDDPDPRITLTGGMPRPHCPAGNLRAESDWIHAHAPGAKTFIVLMNMGSFAKPSFQYTYGPENSHVDLYGLAAYPCRSGVRGCDYDVIDRYVRAAEAWGIPRSRIVPIYQAFGEGGWVTDDGGHYTLPSREQAEQILARWGKLVELPTFDFTYSWGSQKSDLALQQSPDLQTVFRRHNDLTVPASR